MLEKIKAFLNASWGILLAIGSVLLALIGLRTVMGIAKDKKQEKKKDNLIQDNNSIVEKIEQKEKEREEIIDNSNNIYNDLVSGKFKKP